jgi:hypothetical protein
MTNNFAEPSAGVSHGETHPKGIRYYWSAPAIAEKFGFSSNGSTG